MHQPPHRGEEIPLEEFDGLPDWNAQAWEAIKARDAKNLPADQLPGYVAGLSGRELVALRAVLGHEPTDLPVREAIAAALTQRGHTEHNERT